MSCLAGMLEEIDYFTEHLSRGFFAEKQGKTEVQARLVQKSHWKEYTLLRTKLQNQP